MSEPVIADKKPSVIEIEPGTYSWCRCGRSKAQPFCDGSHGLSGITPLEFTITERKKVALCNCKQSAKSPFCDGTHKRL